MASTNLSNGLGLIQAQGIGSGLDIQSLVTQLTQAEGAAVQSRITRESSQLATDISSLGSLKGAVSTFQGVVTPLASAATLTALSATSSDPGTFTATTDATAAAGSYSVEVTQLAQAQQMVSQNFTSGTAASFSPGTLSITVGSKTMNLAIDSTNNTLAGIRDAINSASNNPGVQAAIIGDSTGSRLVLTATSSGAANAITVTSSGSADLVQLNYSAAAAGGWTVGQQAQDAIVKIAGVSFNSASNTVTGLIAGVTLTLKAAAPGTVNSLSVATDQSAILSYLQKFIDGYNAMQKVLKQLTGYNATTQTGGPMQGDPLAVGLASQLRNLSFDVVPGVGGSYNSLAALGVTTDSNGQLSVDQNKLNNALSRDPSIVTRLFSSSKGIGTRLNTVLTAALASNGALAARDTANTERQTAINDEQQALSDRLQVIQARYLEQFTALDTLMSQLKSTSSFLTQQLSSIAAIGNSTNSSSGANSG